jgi:hypothetical protein
MVLVQFIPLSRRSLDTQEPPVPARHARENMRWGAHATREPPVRARHTREKGRRRAFDLREQWRAVAIGVLGWLCRRIVGRRRGATRGSRRDEMEATSAIRSCSPRAREEASKGCRRTGTGTMNREHAGWRQDCWELDLWCTQRVWCRWLMIGSAHDDVRKEEQGERNYLKVNNVSWSGSLWLNYICEADLSEQLSALSLDPFAHICFFAL